MTSSEQDKRQENRESGLEKKGGYEPTTTKLLTDLPTPPPNVDRPEKTPPPEDDGK